MSAPEARVALQLEHVTAGYGSLTILRDISLRLLVHQMVTVVGPNGHGKSTLLKTISGMTRRSSGNIRIDGQDTKGMPAYAVSALGVAHVPQGDALFPEMTVEENLLMGAYLTTDRHAIGAPRRFVWKPTSTIAAGSGCWRTGRLGLVRRFTRSVLSMGVSDEC